MKNEQSLEGLRKRLTIIGVMGMPFCVALTLGLAAYFKGDAMLPFLEDSTTAFNVLVIGAIGTAITMAVAQHTVYKVKQLEDANT